MTSAVFMFTVHYKMTLSSNEVLPTSTSIEEIRKNRPKNCERFSIIVQNRVLYRSTEDSYAAGYSSNSSRISSVARELDILPELLPAAKI